jgi:serine/threonine protein kinase
VRALEDATRAVHELHEHGLVHGDIKPANVMVADDGGRLSDLGLARCTGDLGRVHRSRLVPRPNSFSGNRYLVARRDNKSTAPPASRLATAGQVADLIGALR